MEWNIVLGAACAVAGLLISFAVFTRNRAKDDDREGEVRGTMLSDIGYIKGAVDDIKSEQRSQSKKTEELALGLAKVKGSVERAHERIDVLEGKQKE